MKNITKKQSGFPETDLQEGILMSPVLSVKGNKGRSLMASAKNFNQLEATTLDENGLGFQLVKGVDGKAYALFDSQYINEVAEFADKIAKKNGVYVAGIEEDGAFLRAKDLEQVGSYLGYETMGKKVLYNDSIAAALRGPIRGKA